MFEQFLALIRKYEIIAIYRHVNSDFDALGSQYGLGQLIFDNFPEKKIVYMGASNPDLMSKMGIDFEQAVIEKPSCTLGIALDTANLARLDGDNFEKLAATVKIDHHVVVESYAGLNIEFPEASSTSELIGEFYCACQKTLFLSKQAASWLYFGMVGDTNRFMYEATSTRTFEIAKVLLAAGIDKKAIYQAMYTRPKQELDILTFIYTHYQYRDGLAYYILSDEDLQHLGITRERGSDFVNTLANVAEFQVWMAVTENRAMHNWRVSLRSSGVPVQPIAVKYHGGGHCQASGATVSDLNELEALIQDLIEAIKEENNHASC